MSIRSKVVSCFFVVLFLCTAVLLYNYDRLKSSSRHLTSVNELFLPLSRKIVQLQANIYALAEDMRHYYFNQNNDPKDATFSRMARDLYPYVIQKKFQTLNQMLSEWKGMGSETQELRKWVARSAESFDKLQKQYDKNAFEKQYERLKIQLRTLSRKVDDQSQRVISAAQREAKTNLLALLGVSIFVGLFGILCVAYSNRILRPLPKLISSLKNISDGKFLEGLKVGTNAKDEVSILAREYNRMLDALVERDKKIQKQQKELLEKERLAAVGQLSAEIVHEIRNPLNSISLNIDWLQDELKLTSREVARTVQSISKEVERLNQITESYLVRARLSSEEKAKAEIHEILNEIIAFNREEDRAKNINVITDFSEQDIHVATEKSKLKQVFINIFKNAKEAMPRGGTITLQTRIRKNVSEIRVIDTGHGMNEAIYRQTFKPFYTTKPRGTGLGLSLTKSIVEEANGVVNCETEMGHGTTFTLQFPV